MSVTDLEIDEAIREAWTILYAGAPPSARHLAALLAVTGGTQAHPHWVNVIKLEDVKVFIEQHRN